MYVRFVVFGGPLSLPHGRQAWRYVGIMRICPAIFELLCYYITKIICLFWKWKVLVWLVAVLWNTFMSTEPQSYELPSYMCVLAKIFIVILFYHSETNNLQP